MSPWREPDGAGSYVYRLWAGTVIEVRRPALTLLLPVRHCLACLAPALRAAPLLPYRITFFRFPLPLSSLRL